FLPVSWQPWRFTTQLGITVVLIVLNLRGVKESITAVVPIFLMFIVTHFALIAVTLGQHVVELPAVVADAGRDARAMSAQIGLWPMLFFLLRAYSLGGGTYTGIEAVSNGMPLLREPRVANGKRTMLYMAVSLAFTAA